MPKKDKIQIFIVEIYFSPSEKSYETIKIVYNHMDEIWSFDMADMIDYKSSNNKGFIYIYIYSS